MGLPLSISGKLLAMKWIRFQDILKIQVLPDANANSAVAIPSHQAVDDQFLKISGAQ